MQMRGIVRLDGHGGMNGNENFFWFKRVSQTEMMILCKRQSVVVYTMRTTMKIMAPLPETTKDWSKLPPKGIR
jgi:hypothetical protein